MGARRSVTREITEVSFAHNAKPSLSVELLGLADLFAREKRGELPVALASPVRPEFHTIYIGRRGRGDMVVDFEPVPIGLGRATVVAAGRVEQFPLACRNVDAFMVVFAPELITEPFELLAPTWAQPTIELTASDRRDIEMLLILISEEQARPLDEIQPALLASLVRTILLILERRLPLPKTATPERELFFTILENDCLSTRSVAHYAREVGVTPRHLSDLLRASTGRSAKEIIDERVVLEHKRLLAHTDITIKELAHRTGFDEPSYLVKFFRLRTGMTPSQFRKKLPSGHRS